MALPCETTLRSSWMTSEYHWTAWPDRISVSAYARSNRLLQASPFAHGRHAARRKRHRNQWSTHAAPRIPRRKASRTLETQSQIVGLTMNVPSQRTFPFRRAHWALAASVSVGYVSFALTLHCFIDPVGQYEARYVLALILAVMQILAATYAFAVAVRGRRLQGHGGVGVMVGLTALPRQTQGLQSKAPPQRHSIITSPKTNSRMARTGRTAIASLRRRPLAAFC